MWSEIVSTRWRERPVASILSARVHERPGVSAMAQCEVCGNDYDKTMEITVAGARHVFDSFECAIHAIAPRCEHCGCVVIGHGVEADGRFFCCAHCASKEGHGELRDRTGPQVA